MPFAPPFAHSLAPLTHLLAPHSSLRSRAPLRSFVRLLARSLRSSWEKGFCRSIECVDFISFKTNVHSPILSAVFDSDIFNDEIVDSSLLVGDEGVFVDVDGLVEGIRSETQHSLRSRVDPNRRTRRSTLEADRRTDGHRRPHDLRVLRLRAAGEEEEEEEGEGEERSDVEGEGGGKGTKWRRARRAK